jgi:hypothetical protein
MMAEYWRRRPVYLRTPGQFTEFVKRICPSCHEPRIMPRFAARCGFCRVARQQGKHVKTVARGDRYSREEA